MDPTQIITRRMPLDAAQEAYRLFDNREATKVILQP
jgi:threonine dehydrogenase-like Zn-dependent dehydrogenase